MSALSNNIQNIWTANLWARATLSLLIELIDPAPHLHAATRPDVPFPRLGRGVKIGGEQLPWGRTAQRASRALSPRAGAPAM
jgi:hypothetical protein